jgi:alkylation response protein AidB-like acyl-CoA dehydrogenase
MERRNGLQTVSSLNSWFTNQIGLWADFFTVAVRTGGLGMGGISLLLIEKTMPGVTARYLALDLF